MIWLLTVKTHSSKGVAVNGTNFFSLIFIKLFRLHCAMGGSRSIGLAFTELTEVVFAVRCRQKECAACNHVPESCHSRFSRRVFPSATIHFPSNSAHCPRKYIYDECIPNIFLFQSLKSLLKERHNGLSIELLGIFENMTKALQKRVKTRQLSRTYCWDETVRLETKF